LSVQDRSAVATENEEIDFGDKNSGISDLTKSGDFAYQNTNTV